jgi:tetratricopeptide (TPR) repeat protein
LARGLNLVRLDQATGPTVVEAIGLAVFVVIAFTIGGAAFEFFRGLVAYQPNQRTATYPVTHQGAMQALMQCAEILNAPHPDHQLALTILRPFRDYVHFAEVPANQSEATVACLCATFADCYREAGDYEKAAIEYQRANRRRPGLGADYYASMVIQRGLRDHFRPALQSLETAEAARRRTPFSDRCCWYVTCLVMCWRSGRWWFPKEPRPRKQLISELRELLRQTE